MRNRKRRYIYKQQQQRLAEERLAEQVAIEKENSVILEKLKKAKADAEAKAKADAEAKAKADAEAKAKKIITPKKTTRKRATKTKN